MPITRGELFIQRIPPLIEQPLLSDLGGHLGNCAVDVSHRIVNHAIVPKHLHALKRGHWSVILNGCWSVIISISAATATPANRLLVVGEADRLLVVGGDEGKPISH